MKKIRLLAIAAGVTIPLGAALLFTSCNKNNTLTDKQLAGEAINTLAMDKILNSVITNEIDVPTSLKMVDVLIDNRDYEKTITIDDIKTQEEPTYTNKKSVTFKTIDGKLEYTFSLFYNDVTVKEKEKVTESKLKIAFGGLIKYVPMGSKDTATKHFKAKLENEKEIGETENEVKFKIFDEEGDEDSKYMQLKCEKETSLTKTEYEYQYEVKDENKSIDNEYEIKIKETSTYTEIKLEQESGSAEEKMKFYRTGSGDNVTYTNKNDNDKQYVRVKDVDGYHYEEKKNLLN